MTSANSRLLQSERTARRRTSALAKSAGKSEFAVMATWFWHRCACLEVLALWSLGYALFWLVKPGIYDHQFENVTLPILLILAVANSARVGPREFEFLVTRGTSKRIVIAAHARTVVVLFMMLWGVVIVVEETELSSIAFSSLTSMVVDAPIASVGLLADLAAVNLTLAILFGSVIFGTFLYGAASMVLEQRVRWSSLSTFKRCRSILGWIILLALIASNLAFLGLLAGAIGGVVSRRSLMRFDAV